MNMKSWSPICRVWFVYLRFIGYERISLMKTLCFRLILDPIEIKFFCLKERNKKSDEIVYF